jgi:phosphoglycolate phosphatase
MPIRAALFDFDGTLADGFAAITASTNHVRHSYGLAPLPEGEVREYVGLGLRKLMEDLAPGADPDEAAARYRGHHDTVMYSGTKLLPGVAEVIPELARRGLKLAVCSNKAVAFTRKLVDHFGLAPHFAAVLGPDDVGGRAKPDPAMVREACARLRVSPAEAVYVGDMAVDVRTAKAAGIPVWLVPGGAAGREPAAAAGPDRRLAAFADLLALLPAGA